MRGDGEDVNPMSLPAPAPAPAPSNHSTGDNAGESTASIRSTAIIDIDAAAHPEGVTEVRDSVGGTVWGSATVAMARKIELIPLSGGNVDGATNLGRCVGECDEGQCAAGLKCFHDSPSTVPGCSGTVKTAGWDYCYDPDHVDTVIDGEVSKPARRYFNLDNDYLELDPTFSVGNGIPLAVGQEYTHVYLIQFRESNVGWRTLFRGDNDHCTIVEASGRRLGFFSNRDDNQFHGTNYNVHVSDFTFLAVTGNGAAKVSSFYVGDTKAGFGLVGTVPRTCAGTL